MCRSFARQRLSFRLTWLIIVCHRITFLVSAQETLLKINTRLEESNRWNVTKGIFHQGNRETSGAKHSIWSFKLINSKTECWNEGFIDRLYALLVVCGIFERIWHECIYLFSVCTMFFQQNRKIFVKIKQTINCTTFQTYNYNFPQLNVIDHRKSGKIQALTSRKLE